MDNNMGQLIQPYTDVNQHNLFLLNLYNYD